MSKDEAEKADLYHVIGKEIDDEYIKTLKNLVLNLDTIKRVQKDVKIVYTPLHGAGNMPVQRILKEIGFENVYVVPEQEKTKWRFPNSKLSKSRRCKCIQVSTRIGRKKLMQMLYLQMTQMQID